MSDLRKALEELLARREVKSKGTIPNHMIRELLAAHPSEPTVTTADGWTLVGPAIPSVALEPEPVVTDLRALTERWRAFKATSSNPGDPEDDGFANVTEWGRMMCAQDLDRFITEYGKVAGK